MMGQIPQSDPFLHDSLVSECSPRLLETHVQLSVLPGRIQTKISLFPERSLPRELVTLHWVRFPALQLVLLVS